MKHTPDQDLLMLVHNSLGPVRTAFARLHLWRCARCRKRMSEFAVLSQGVAAAVRPGMAAWKPIGMALRMKLMLGTLALGVAILGVEGTVLYINSPHGGAACQAPTPSTAVAAPANPKYCIPPKAPSKPSFAKKG